MKNFTYTHQTSSCVVLYFFSVWPLLDYYAGTDLSIKIPEKNVLTKLTYPTPNFMVTGVMIILNDITLYF